jgi:hypothetical protein
MVAAAQRFRMSKLLTPDSVLGALMKRETNLNNAALLARRQAAIPRGVGFSHPIFI